MHIWHGLNINYLPEVLFAPFSLLKSSMKLCRFYVVPTIQILTETRKKRQY